MSTALYSCRNLHRVYMQKIGLWLFIWTHDDGFWTRDKRLCFLVTDSPGNFSPYGGQFVLEGNTPPNYVYGVVHSIESYGGQVKVFYQDLGPFYGAPVELKTGSLPGGTGASPLKGNYLEATFTGIGDIGQSIVWKRKEFSDSVSTYGSVLEVTDSAIVGPNVTPTPSGYSVPTGTLVVEYQRDWAGRVICDGNGIPQPALIDSTKGITNGNTKVGYLALKFVANYFGLGQHGWVGGSSTTTSYYPFEIFVSTDSSGNSKVTLYPGSINQTVPTNILDAITQTITSTNYVILTCTSDGYSVTESTWSITDTAPTPVESTANTPPSTFYVLIGMIGYTAPVSPATIGTLTPYNFVNTDLNAVPFVWIQVSNPSPVPYGLPYENYYNWNITAA